MSASKLIILDRDGVINHDSDEFIKSPEEWIPIDGSADAIRRLNEAGYAIGVASNQSGIGRGLFDLHMLENIHHKMHQFLASHQATIDKLVFCPDHPDKPGPNRKPAPGMALELLEFFNASPDETWFVGDTLSDIRCALAAGCKPALVKTGKGMRTLAQEEFKAYEVPVYEDLASFVDSLIGTQN